MKLTIENHTFLTDAQAVDYVLHVVRGGLVSVQFGEPSYCLLTAFVGNVDVSTIRYKKAAGHRFYISYRHGSPEHLRWEMRDVAGVHATSRGAK